MPIVAAAEPIPAPGVQRLVVPSTVRRHCDSPRDETHQRRKNQRFAYESHDRESERHERDASHHEQHEEVPRLEHVNNIPLLRA